MKNKIIGGWGICILLFLESCGMPNVGGIESLMDHQPKVIKISPSEGESVDSVSHIRVVFSHPIKPETLNKDSFFVGLDVSEKLDADIIKDIEAGDIRGIEGTYEFESENEAVTFRFKTALSWNGKCVVLINDLVQNEDGVPLNQNRGRAPEPFYSYFYLESADQENGVSADYVSQDVDQSSDGSGPVLEEKIEPKLFVINEFMYDAVGKDTEGDLFIELYGTKNANIGGSSINFISGDDGTVYDSIILPSDATLSDSGIYLVADSVTGQSTVSHIMHPDMIDNFDPQNGPDAIQLVGSSGKLWDAVSYGAVVAEKGTNGLAIKEGDPAPTTMSGQSLSRIEGADSDSNFVDFKILDVPTPGSL